MALARLPVVLVGIAFGELRVDHVFLLAVGAGGALAGVSGLRAFRLLIHGLAELHGSLRQCVGLGLDGRRVVAFERFLEIGHGVLNRAALGVADLRAMLGERLFGGMHQRLAVVLGLDRGLANL